MIDMLFSKPNLMLYLFAYSLGTLPTTYFLARKKNHIIKTFDDLFKPISLSFFIFDLFKGFIPVSIGYALGAPKPILLLTIFFALLGHCFSPFLKFYGGKGEATTLGGMLVIDVVCATVGLLIFLSFAIIGKSKTLGVILGVVLAFILFLLRMDDFGNLLFILPILIIIWFKNRKDFYDLMKKA